MSGLIFDKYEVQNRLAIGGMGEVFYAVQTGAVKGFERPVILKNLLPDLAAQEGFIEQFLDEARVAATLNHPNVVSIYEVGMWNGVYFIAMEYIKGRNIAQMMKASIKKQLPAPPVVIARIIHDAAQGLDHAHTARDSQGQPLNIVHRDISPQNIMVREDGVTKVVDFGIARASNRATRTATGAVKGKLAYMAPEQILSRNVTARADQFALGVVLWEMCARRRLFQADQDIELIKKVMEGVIPPLQSVVPGLPAELDEIVQKMMQRDANLRYDSCAEVARELSGFLQKFSPPSSESPVAAYLRTLGTEDLVPIAARATPSKNQNFVISLAGDKAAAGKASLDSKVLTTPLPSAQVVLEATLDRQRLSRGKLIALGLAFFVAAAIGSALVFREMNRPAPVAVVTPPVEVPQPVPVVPPEPATVEPARPPVDVRPGKLSVTSNPPGASLRVDGRPRGKTPQSFDVESGKSVFLQLEKPGFKEVEQEVKPLDPGQERAVEVKLDKRPAGPQPTGQPTGTQPGPVATGAGFLSVQTDPWSKVSVGEEYVGSTPLFKYKLNPGRYVVTLVNEGAGIKTTRTVDIKPGEVSKLDVKLK